MKEPAPQPPAASRAPIAAPIAAPPHASRSDRKAVERLFPFALRARILLVGRDTLRRSKSRLHFVLIARDLSAGSRAEVLSEFAHYPVVEACTGAELEKHFGCKGTKVVGFAKSKLAQSIYAELKPHRINRPPVRPS